MRAPAAGEVWVHVDRITNPAHSLWAVQFYTAGGQHRYKVVGSVKIERPAETRYLGLKAGDVTATIVVPGGRVRISGRTAVIA